MDFMRNLFERLNKENPRLPQQLLDANYRKRLGDLAIFIMIASGWQMYIKYRKGDTDHIETHTQLQAILIQERENNRLLRLIVENLDEMSVRNKESAAIIRNIEASMRNQSHDRFR